MCVTIGESFRAKIIQEQCLEGERHHIVGAYGHDWTPAVNQYQPRMTGKANVWAIGKVIYDLFSLSTEDDYDHVKAKSSRAYHVENNGDSLPNWIEIPFMHDLHRKMSPYTPELSDLISRCMAADPASRPSAQELYATTLDLLNSRVHKEKSEDPVSVRNPTLYYRGNEINSMGVEEMNCFHTLESWDYFYLMAPARNDPDDPRLRLYPLQTQQTIEHEDGIRDDGVCLAKQYEADMAAVIAKYVWRNRMAVAGRLRKDVNSISFYEEEGFSLPSDDSPKRRNSEVYYSTSDSEYDIDPISKRYKRMRRDKQAIGPAAAKVSPRVHIDEMLHGENHVQQLVYRSQNGSLSHPVATARQIPDWAPVRQPSHMGIIIQDSKDSTVTADGVWQTPANSQADATGRPAGVASKQWPIFPDEPILTSESVGVNRTASLPQPEAGDCGSPPRTGASLHPIRHRSASRLGGTLSAEIPTSLVLNLVPQAASTGTASEGHHQYSHAQALGQNANAQAGSTQQQGWAPNQLASSEHGVPYSSSHGKSRQQDAQPLGRSLSTTEDQANEQAASTSQREHNVTSSPLNTDTDQAPATNTALARGRRGRGRLRGRPPDLGQGRSAAADSVGRDGKPGQGQRARVGRGWGTRRPDTTMNIRNATSQTLAQMRINQAAEREKRATKRAAQ